MAYLLGFWIFLKQLVHEVWQCFQRSVNPGSICSSGGDAPSKRLPSFTSLLYPWSKYGINYIDDAELMCGRRILEMSDEFGNNLGFELNITRTLATGHDSHEI